MNGSTPRAGGRRRPGSLRTRLAGVLALTVALVVVVVASVTWLLVVHQLDRGQDVALLREATRIQRLVQTGSSFLASGSEACEYASEPACTRVVSADDHVESGDSAMHVTAEALAVARGGAAPAYYTVEAPGRNVRVVVVRVEEGEAVMVGVPTTTTDRTALRVGIALVALGGVGVALSGLVGFGVATVGLRPVRSLAGTIERVRATRDPGAAAAFDRRAESERNDELGRLARSFSAMLAELTTAQQAQRQLVSDASHELRTPLTTLRTNLALLQRDDRAGRTLPAETRVALQVALEHEVQSLQTLIADLVDLARGDEPQDPREPVDLASVLDEAVPAAARHWPQLVFERSGPDHSVAVVEGAPARLVRLVSVLLDNAGKYGAPPAVEVALSTRGQSAVVTVADRGPGIPESDLERVFDRFFRSEASRALPGSGLGLAIAHQIVVDHGGAIAARRREGGGTVVTVELPLAPS